MQPSGDEMINTQQLVMNSLLDRRYYSLGGKSKIRSSYGTGFLFPALYESEYAWTNQDGDKINAEKTKSFDIGYETYFDNLDLDFNITYFDILVEDPIMGSNMLIFKIMFLVQKIKVKD